MKLRYIIAVCMTVFAGVVSCVCVNDAQPDVHVRIQEISTAHNQFYVKAQVENKGIQKFDFLFDEPGIVTLTDKNGEDICCAIKPRAGACNSTTLLPKSTQEYMFDIFILQEDWNFSPGSISLHDAPYTLTLALPPTVPNAEARQTFYFFEDFSDGVGRIPGNLLPVRTSRSLSPKLDSPPYLAIQSCIPYIGGEIEVFVNLYNNQEDPLVFQCGLPMSLFDCNGDTVTHTLFQPGGRLRTYSVPSQKVLRVPTYLSVDTPVTERVYTVRIHHPANAKFYVDTQFKIPEKGPVFSN